MWISPFVVTSDAISNLVPLPSSSKHEDDYVDWRIQSLQSLTAVLDYFSHLYHGIDLHFRRYELFYVTSNQ